MRSFPALIAALAWLGLIIPLQADDTRSAYAGEHERNIKALSQEDVAALRNGEGMGTLPCLDVPEVLHGRSIAQTVRASITVFTLSVSSFRRISEP